MATQLPAPQNIRTYYSGNVTRITWDEILEAVEYKATVNGITFTRTNPSPSIPAGVQNVGNAAAVIKNVQVQAIGDGETYTDSEVSSVDLVCIPPSRELFRRLNPQIIPLSNRFRLQWNKVEESGETNTITYTESGISYTDVTVTYNATVALFQRNLSLSYYGLAYNFSIGITDANKTVYFTGQTPSTLQPLPTLATPTGLTISEITAGSAVVSWNPVEGFFYYQLRYSYSGGDVQVIESDYYTSAILSGLQAETTYNIELVAIGDHTNYLDSSAVTTTFQTEPATTPLATPTGLYADNITSNSARTNWQAVENASNYKVQYKAAGDTVWTETYTD